MKLYLKLNHQYKKILMKVIAIDSDIIVIKGMINSVFDRSGII